MLSPTTIKLALISVSILLTALNLFASPTRLHAISSSLPSIPGKRPLSRQSQFVADVLHDDNEIDGRFDNRTLVQLCGSRKWIPGLIFRCEAPEGGVANVRNVILNCLRYAIEAGATSIITPQIHIHTTTTPDAPPVPFPFSHFFDLSHFTTHLSSACPQISLIHHLNDLFYLPSTARPIPLNPTSFEPASALVNGSILSQPGNWSANFADYLSIEHPTPPSADLPLLISVAPSLLSFPLSYDAPHLVSSFGRLLRPNPDVRRVAAAVLWALDEKYALGFDATGGVQPSMFYGAHLRTGEDAAAAGWTPYAVQETNFLSHASTSHLDIIFASSSASTDEDVDAFTATAKRRHNITVETTQRLLGVRDPDGTWRPREGMESEWGVWSGMGWDVQGVVEAEVFLRASVFGGEWESSLSWGVAMRRHVVEGGDDESERWDETRRDLPRSKKTRDAHTRGRGSSGRRREPLSRGMAKRGDAASMGTFASARDGETKEREEEGSASADTGIDQGAKEGEMSFEDTLSVVFGPEDEGGRVKASLWP
ncbi:alternative oxidase [Diplocarpon rosae]|nr:alternative oxidase [Diplocarpon rosae]